MLFVILCYNRINSGMHFLLLTPTENMRGEERRGEERRERGRGHHSHQMKRKNKITYVGLVLKIGMCEKRKQVK
jgi:hypothetical protein